MCAGQATDAASFSYLDHVTAKQRGAIPFSSNEMDASVEAFEAMYREHSSRIYSLACRMSGSPQDGEDLLQEIFLQAYRKLGTFKGESSLGCIYVNMARSFSRALNTCDFEVPSATPSSSPISL